ncbi:MAG: hypothetical protein K0S22_1915 [Oscillospiraceae bacterium]|jgi:hypothetical protein|nr:hypothetical protein [Oscillospiraceae bacterium]
MVFYILDLDFSAKKARKIERYRGLAILWGMAKCLESLWGLAYLNRPSIQPVIVRLKKRTE